MASIPLQSLGAHLGSTLAPAVNSVGKGIQSLIQYKMKEAQNTQKIKQLEDLGVQPEFAKFYVSQSPEIQKALGQNIGQFLVPKEGQAGAEGQPGKTGGFSGAQLGEAFKSPQQKAMEERNVIAREKLSQSQQQHIDKSAGKFFDSIEVESKPARQVIRHAKDALQTLKTNKAITGLAGKITPEFLQTPEGQDLLTNLKQIVLIKSQQGKGVPSKLRLALEEGAKAQLWHHPKVIEKILTKIANDPENIREVAKDKSRLKIQKEFGENIPKNYRSLVESETANYIKTRTDKYINRASNELQSKFPASTVPGKFATDPITGLKFKSENGEWKYIGESEEEL